MQENISTRRTMKVTASNLGFTIVELLIVIAVIGVLASIIVVAYNGITVRANNNAKIAELKALQKLFEAYKALNGTYPQQDLDTSTVPTANPAGSSYKVGYCLGTGYPSAGTPSLPSCYSMTTSSNLSYTYRENDTTATSIRTALAAVGKVPGPVNSHKVNGVMGPVAFYHAAHIDLVTVIRGETISDCPGGTTRYYPSDQTTLVSQNYRLECSIRLMK